MQDRFKFRAWLIDSNKYLYSVENGIQTKDKIYYIPFNALCSNPNKFVVEQCTGLKDKNGKLIYEGDIVEATDGSKTKGRVIYDTTFGVYMTKLLENNQGIALEQYVDLDTLKLKLKVIGNIHENPELLEE